jgi:ketosteroid isomerase-like protein
MRITTSLLAIATLATMFLTIPAQAKEMPKSDAKTVAAITQFENDAVKADLAGDASFYEKNFANNWSGGDSNGTWYTKQQLISSMKDKEKNKMNSEEISNLDVRTYGDTAIATYINKYDLTQNGANRHATILTTDTFAKQNGKWMQVSGHSSVMSTKATSDMSGMDTFKPYTDAKK